MAKVTRCLIPLLMVCYFTAYLDRVMREVASCPHRILTSLEIFRLGGIQKGSSERG